MTLFVKRPALAGVIFAAAAACAMAAPQPLIIDARRSQIEVQVRATAHAFTVRLMAFTAAMTVDPETGGVNAAQMRFHFSDLDTGNPARNRAMQEWQETARFPDGEFVLTSLNGGGGHYVGHGRLTLHGIVRELAFPVSITTDRQRYSIDGTARLDTREHGLSVIHKLALLRVDPNVTVRFHLQGSTEPPILHRDSPLHPAAEKNVP